jgi:hypothetical protein
MGLEPDGRIGFTSGTSGLGKTKCYFALLALLSICKYRYKLYKSIVPLYRPQLTPQYNHQSQTTC